MKLHSFSTNLLELETSIERMKRLDKSLNKGRPAISQPDSSTSQVISLDDCIKLTDVCPVDLDGKPLEGPYPELYVMTDWAKNVSGEVLFKTSYDAALYFGNDVTSGFNMSSALFYNIWVSLAETYLNNHDKNIKKVLDQYMEGRHVFNTIHTWPSDLKKNGLLIHYPSRLDFNGQNSGTDEINQFRSRKSYEFDRTGFTDELLEHALNSSNKKDYFRMYTGLKEPERLIGLSEQIYGKPVNFWCPDNPEQAGRMSGAWSGVRDDNFYLNTVDDLGDCSAFCGVFLSVSAAQAACKKQSDLK